jgi:hypothetical protein
VSGSASFSEKLHSAIEQLELLLRELEEQIAETGTAEMEQAAPSAPAETTQHKPAADHCRRACRAT